MKPSNYLVDHALKLKTGISRRLNLIWCRIMIATLASSYSSLFRIFGHKLFDLGDQLWDAEWFGHHPVLAE